MKYPPLERGDRGDFRNEPIFIVKQYLKPYLDVALRRFVAVRG